jgi:hypothetical protein
MSLPEDDELRRRLADLAESAGPWADPFPAVMRHAHTEPRHRWALPVGRRKWSIAAAVVITLVVGIALAMHKCQCSAPDDGPASNQAEHARVRPLGPAAIGRYVGSRCATVAPLPEASTPTLPGVSVNTSVHISRGMRVDTTILVSSALTATSQATVRAVIIDDDGVVAQLAVSPEHATIPEHSMVTFTARGVLTCPADGLPLPPGNYGLVAVVTTQQPFGSANTIVSAPVIIAVSGSTRS